MHPDYGVHYTLSSRVLAYAKTHGVRLAAQRFNLGMTTIYRWRRRA